MNWLQIIPHSMRNKDFSNQETFDLLRAWRNAQLAASDWTQLPDIALTSNEVEAWRQYRHELREMLKQNDDPKLIVLPEPPK